MKKNVGTMDRIIRYVLGLFLISMALWAPGGYKWLAALGVVLFLTATVSFCGIYSLLGLTTCPTYKK